MILNNDVSDTLMVVWDHIKTLFEQFSQQGLYTFNEHSGCLTTFGVIWAAVYMLLMVALAFLFYKKDKVLRFCDRYLTHAFVAVWMLGFVVYDLGMYPDHSADWLQAFLAMLGVGPMAIIHAFGMFILQSDVSAIHDACHNSALYMSFFSIAHLLAAFISMVFVIRHFGFNIVANFIRMIKTYFFVKDQKDLYVFWGMNDATYYLAKDINKNTANEARIMIIRENNTTEDPNKRIGMDRLFSFLSVSNNNLDKLQELQKERCLTNSTFGSLTDVHADDDNDLIRRELRLSSIVRLMNHTTEKVHMFLLDDDEESNLQAVGNLKRDKSVNDYVQSHKVIFYCHARHNSIHRVIEDEPSHKNIEVRVIDSAHLGVEQLKLEENISLQPVSFVDIQADATVSSTFNALVVGFSNVGLDMVRFLYEFGAFVKNGKDGEKSDKVERSDFHCYVVDKEMKSLAGTFAGKAVAINPVLDPKDEEEARKSLISLHHMDCQSMEFFKQLKDWLPTINYIVLATGDDEFNMSQAVRLFKLAIRYNTDMNRLRIMVRVQHDENGHFQQIAYHYNRLWKAECNSTDEEKKMNQKVIPAAAIVDGPITPFGSTKKIYTYDHIINESLKESAKSFKEKYDISYYRHQGKPNPKIDWDQEQNNAMQLFDEGDYKDKSPTYSGMLGLRRKQGQNFANSLHIMTKVLLARKALNIDEGVCLHGLVRIDNKKTKPTYGWTEDELMPIEHVQQVMDVLAQTEHLRWVASHEIHGYQIDQNNPSIKDEARLFQCYMCDWNQLQAPDKIFDYNTVDVSFIEKGLMD